MNKSGKETPVRTVDGGQSNVGEAITHFIFITMCRKYGITPTKRQLSKFRNKKGILYKKAHGGA